MKKIKIVMLGVFSFLEYILSAQNQGVDFQMVPFQKALERAKKEQKMIFMDCYTSWCGPCKYMSEKVFVLEKAGRYFNTRYVNIKVDMEEGEGKELAERFAVQAFPTFLLIDTSGHVCARVEGGSEIDDFIIRLEKAQDEKSSVAYWDKLYEGGKLNRKEQVEYLKVLVEARQWEKAHRVSEALLARLSDKQKVSKEYWFIFNHQSLSPFQSPNFKYVLEHKADFAKQLGEQVVEDKLYRMYNRWVMSFISGVILGKHEYRQSQMDTVKKQLVVFAPERKHELEIKCEIAELRHNKRGWKMIEEVKENLGSLPQSDLWDIATGFTIFSKEKDPEFFKQLIDLGKQLEEITEDKELKGYMQAYFGYYMKFLDDK